jgi:hypothetical protein
MDVIVTLRGLKERRIVTLSMVNNALSSLQCINCYGPASGGGGGGVGITGNHTTHTLTTQFRT